MKCLLESKAELGKLCRRDQGNGAARLCTVLTIVHLRYCSAHCVVLRSQSVGAAMSPSSAEVNGAA